MKNSFRKRISDFVTLHPDELLTIDQFARVIKTWDHEGMSLEAAYDYYKEKFFEVPGTTIHIEEPDISEAKPGFKSIWKYSYFLKELPEIPPYTPNSFPLKENLKKYQLHKVGPRGTYMIDIMFGENGLAYLVCINVNTKYGMIELLNTTEHGDALKANARTATSYLRALKKMMKVVEEYNPIKYLIGDDEGAFGSRLAKQFYKDHGIQFHGVPRMIIEGKKGTDPNHSSLAVVDRFIRTIRDMLYNCGYEATPKAIKWVLFQYNNAAHSTLSRALGQPISPNNLMLDKDKEEYIVMRINKANLATKLSPGYLLDNNTRVKVYNEKNVFGKRRKIHHEGEIVDRKAGLYVVKINLNGKEMTLLVPRYKISPLYMESLQF